MSPLTAATPEQRILVLAPTGQDSALICRLFGGADLICDACHGVAELVDKAREAAGCLLLTEEALDRRGIGELVSLLRQQEPWSDLPMVVLTSGGGLTHESLESVRLFGGAGDVTLLERPLRSVTLLSAVNAALRARRRQYHVRDLLGEREREKLVLAGQVRQLATLNSELEQFAYVASHDLQEPLRMITAYLDLLRKRLVISPGDPSAQYMAYVIGGANRMRDLINALLTFARIGQRSTAASPVDTAQVVREVSELLRAQIEAGGATIIADALPVIDADETQISQLFLNLISNALKFRGVDPPFIVIHAEDSESEWRFTVRDNGIGIPDGDQSRLFQIFQRLHPVERYPGSGIGLATCKKVVDRHHGRIGVESSSGGGTTFWFTIPKRP